MVAGWFHTYHVLMWTEPSPYFRGIPLETFVSVWIIFVFVTCPIATLLGSVMLKRELSSMRWTVNWVITAFASSAGGVAIFWTMLIVFGVSQEAAEQHPFSSNPNLSVAEAIGVLLLAWVGACLGFGMLIGIESAAAALLLAPLALLARRFVLRRTRVAEPTGGASQTHP